MKEASNLLKPNWHYINYLISDSNGSGNKIYLKVHNFYYFPSFLKLLWIILRVELKSKGDRSVWVTAAVTGAPRPSDTQISKPHCFWVKTTQILTYLRATAGVYLPLKLQFWHSLVKIPPINFGFIVCIIGRPGFFHKSLVYVLPTARCLNFTTCLEMFVMYS